MANTEMLRQPYAILFGSPDLPRFAEVLTDLRLTRQQDRITILAGLHNLFPCREELVRAVVKVAL